jgi:competence protein ComEC
MVITASIMQLKGQRYSGMGILSIVAVLIIWSEPQTTRTIGFILSFTTVFGLCLLLRTLQWKLLGPHDVFAPTLQATRYNISTLWVVCLCAFMTITPLVLHFFGTISLIGLISGLGGVFLLFILLITGIVRLAIGWVHPNIDQCMAWAIQNTSTTLIDACQQYEALTRVHGFGFLYTHQNSPGALLSILFLLTIGFIVLKTGHQKTKAITALFITACLVFNNNRNQTTITTINVGHGTCHIITDETQTTLVDAGSRANLDVGITTVLPSLHKLGINKIDTLILTHNDLDHCSGILDLMQHIEIKEICVTRYALLNQTTVVKKIIQVAKNKDIQINTIFSGWCKSTKNTTIQAIWPDKKSIYTSSNESSVVLSIRSFGRHILLTGDINEKTISKLLLMPIGQGVDVLEMPHHGQWSEEAVSFITKLNPLVVIQSTGPARFSSDRWFIPKQTERFVTCIDGNKATGPYLEASSIN